jgi:hypothetical protein
MAQRTSEERRKHAFAILDRNFGTPENQKKGWDMEGSAISSAATLLAAQANITFYSAQKHVIAWYKRAEKTP